MLCLGPKKRLSSLRLELMTWFRAECDTTQLSSALHKWKVYLQIQSIIFFQIPTRTPTPRTRAGRTRYPRRPRPVPSPKNLESFLHRRSTFRRRSSRSRWSRFSRPRRSTRSSYFQSPRTRKLSRNPRRQFRLEILRTFKFCPKKNESMYSDEICR